MTLYEDLAALPAKERDALMSSLGYTKKRLTTPRIRSKLIERKPPRLSDAKRAHVAREWSEGVEKWSSYTKEQRLNLLEEARIAALRKVNRY